MKHITTIIALALTLGTLVPLAAQPQMTAKGKTYTNQTRAENCSTKSKGTIISRCCSRFGKQHFRTGSQSTDFQTRRVGKCQFCQEFYFHGKQKSHRTSQF